MNIDRQQVAPGDVERTAWVLDLVRSKVELRGLRTLDLACRTGAFSTAFANAGAQVLGIEGRQENLDLAPESSAGYLLGDVRKLNLHVHGIFDVTLCLGILYHLDAADVVQLLRSMRSCTTNFAIIDTHVAPPEANNLVTVEGSEFYGSLYAEPEGWWSSINNPHSWWFTIKSLHMAIRLAGWSNVEDLEGPPCWPSELTGRQWLVIS